LRAIPWTWEEFLRNRELWNQVLQTSLDNNVFLTWEWLSSWWKYFGDKKKFLTITVADDSKILAAAPLMHTRSSSLGAGIQRIEFIATPASDYQSLLLTERSEEHVRKILEYVTQTETDWDIIELRDIPENSLTATLLRAASHGTLEFGVKQLEECPYIPLPESFEGFLRTVDPHVIKEAKRRERRLTENFKVDFRIWDNPDTVDEAMEIVCSLHQKRQASTGERGIFSEEGVKDFHFDVARSFARKGWLLLAFLTLNDEPAAALYNFRYAGKLYSYLSGFDPEYSKYAVGTIIDLHLIEHSIRTGLREYDFTRGDETYKTQWNTHVRRNLRIRATKRAVVRLTCETRDLISSVHAKIHRAFPII
jgi:CelD/BcsL family acetyltransferase involved in cellulose biosynthesis